MLHLPFGYFDFLKTLAKIFKFESAERVEIRVRHTTRSPICPFILQVATIAWQFSMCRLAPSLQQVWFRSC